jgi:hypothetical protein
MNVVVADMGNSIIKFKTASVELDVPHALQPLSETDFQRIQTRAGKDQMPLDYVRVNGTPFVIGEHAERHGVLSRQEGAARYRREYYGVLAAAMCARLYSRSGEISFFGSHAPGDIAYRDDLMDAVVGEWEVTIQGRKRLFNITYANTFEEPLGGLMNVLLSEDGQHYKRTDIDGGSALVIDIGGHTTDWIGMQAGGAIDYGNADSIPLGIQDVIDTFEKSFRDHHRQDVKESIVLPPDRVREALRTGTFYGGGRTYDCQDEANEAINVLLNRLATSYQKIAGGALAWDSIILTGGGCGLLYDYLLPILRHDHVILADTPEDIHFANVRGGMKLWRLYDSWEDA